MGADWLWLTRTQASQLIGCSAANFDQRVRPRLERSATRGTKAKLRFDAKQVVAAWVAHREEITSTGKPEASTDSELERGRAIDNQQKEIRLMKEVGRVVEIAHVRPGLLLFAASLRDAGTRLVKRYGNDAGDILNEGIKAGEREITSYFDRVETECPAPPARDVSRKRVDPPANDAAVRRG